MQRHPQRPHWVVIVLVAAATVLGGAFLVQAGSLDPGFTDFEETECVPGTSIQAHRPDCTITPTPVTGINPDEQAWSVRQLGVDEGIVSISGTNKAWRLSDQSNTGDLQTRPHSPHAGDLPGSPGTKLFAGESTAIDDFGSETPNTPNYYAQLDFRSATGTAQTGTMIDVTAACGDDCRHGFVRIIDDGSGFDLRFFETGDNTGTNSCASFVPTDLDLNLSYTEWHTLGIEIFFVDGFATATPGEQGNDVVNVYVDTQLVHTGTSWETCYAFVGSGDPRGVDRLAFSRGSSAASDAGGGLYFDNVLVTELCPEGNCVQPADFENVGECISMRFEENCMDLTGRDRAECNHEQQVFCHDLFGVPSGHTNNN